MANGQIVSTKVRSPEAPASAFPGILLDCILAYYDINVKRKMPSRGLFAVASLLHRRFGGQNPRDGSPNAPRPNVSPLLPNRPIDATG